MQCEDFFASHKYMRAIASEDTALSAMEIAHKGIRGRAAICSTLAAEMYGLQVLAKGIETNKRNFTRFLIIAAPQLAAQLNDGLNVDKVSIVFTLQHEEGCLAKVLTALAENHMNLTKIQSLPIIGEEWRYQFYVDFTFTDHHHYQNAMNAIQPLMRDIEILGAYKKAETPE
jgi:prephenate dehydratase